MRGQAASVTVSWTFWRPPKHDAPRRTGSALDTIWSARRMLEEPRFEAVALPCSVAPSKCWRTATASEVIAAHFQYSKSTLTRPR